MTPGEQLRLRKQQKAEKEAERLKKVTENAYKENRRKYSKIKAKQSQVEVFRNNDVNKKLMENYSNLYESDANFGCGVGDFGNKKNADYGNHVIQKNGNNYEISGDEVFDSSDISVVNLSEYVTQKQPKRDYTHCFGEDSSDEEQENENVFEDHNETTNGMSPHFSLKALQFFNPLLSHSCDHTETSQLIGFYIMATLAGLFIYVCMYVCMHACMYVLSSIIKKYTSSLKAVMMKIIMFLM